VSDLDKCSASTIDRVNGRISSDSKCAKSGCQLAADTGLKYMMAETVVFSRAANSNIGVCGSPRSKALIDEAG
jgi:hypothetical protein